MVLALGKIGDSGLEVTCLQGVAWGHWGWTCEEQGKKLSNFSYLLRKEG